MVKVMHVREQHYGLRNYSPTRFGWQKPLLENKFFDNPGSATVA